MIDFNCTFSLGAAFPCDGITNAWESVGQTLGRALVCGKRCLYAGKLQEILVERNVRWQTDGRKTW